MPPCPLFLFNPSHSIFSLSLSKIRKNNLKQIEMESNTPVIAKKELSIIHVALFGVSGNSLHFSAAREYEFSCSNTPNNFFAAIASSNKRHRHIPFFTCAHAPPTLDDDVATVNAVKGVLEMLNNETVVEASPAALPGFGRSPMVRQLIRVTDSPFPLVESQDDKDNQVDKAAEEFIKRFYKELRKQT